MDLERPDLSGRPHQFTVIRDMDSGAEEIFRAWTEGFDWWFAAPGAISMRPQVGEPYVFEVVHEGSRHAHYGRFLALQPGRLIALTWLSGRGGTDGAETVVTVELAPQPPGSRLQLTHAGFYGADAARRHSDSWPHILAHLDETLSVRRPGS